MVSPIRSRKLVHGKSLLWLLSIVTSLSYSSAQTGSIDVADIFLKNGNEAFAQFGASVAAAGDVNGDGFDDVIVASRGGGQGPGSPGYVQVLSGMNGSVLYEFRGVSAAEKFFGLALASAGDVNGDGFPDIIIGSPNPDPAAPILGSVYVLSGADGTRLHRFVEGSFNQDFGRAVAGVGDVDGDGADDIAIGSPLASFSRGSVEVRSGATGQVLRTFLGVGGEQLGQALSPIGDLNLDGTPDVLIGSPGGIPGSCPACIRIFSGLDGTPLLTIVDEDPDSMLGAAVAQVGDITGDGISEILAGAPRASNADQSVGAAYVFSGATGTAVFVCTGPITASVPSEFGTAVGSGGDIDGDGVPDIVVGAPNADGAVDGFLRGAIFSYSGFDGSLLFSLAGEEDRDSFGLGASIVGDANSDGFDDVAAGAALSTNSATGDGSVRVVRRMAKSGELLCRGEPNSTGAPSTLAALSVSEFEVAANDLSLEVSGLPPLVLGFFIVSRNFGVFNAVGGGDGRLCIGSSDVGRYSSSLNASSAKGEVAFDIDNTSVPLPSAGSTGLAVEAGDTLNFQFWHRDTSAAGLNTSNLSDAVTVTFQ